MENPSQQDSHLVTYAIIIFVIGLLFRYIIGKRRFNRRGIAGTQYFTSYSKALIITAIEKVFNVLGLFCIIAAIILWLISNAA